MILTSRSSIHLSDLRGSPSGSMPPMPTSLLIRRRARRAARLVSSFGRTNRKTLTMVASQGREHLREGGRQRQRLGTSRNAMHLGLFLRLEGLGISFIFKSRRVVVPGAVDSFHRQVNSSWAVDAGITTIHYQHYPLQEWTVRAKTRRQLQAFEHDMGPAWGEWRGRSALSIHPGEISCPHLSPPG